MGSKFFEVCDVDEKMTFVNYSCFHKKYGKNVQFPCFTDSSDDWIMKKRFFNGPFGLVSEVFHTELLGLMGRNVVENKLAVDANGDGGILSKVIYGEGEGTKLKNIDKLYEEDNYFSGQKWFPLVVLANLQEGQSARYSKSLVRAYQDHSLVQILDTIKGNNIKTLGDEMAPMFDMNLASAFIEGHYPSPIKHSVPPQDVQEEFVMPIGNRLLIHKWSPDLEEEFREAALSLVSGSKRADYEELCASIARDNVVDFLGNSILDKGEWHIGNFIGSDTLVRAKNMSKQVKSIYDKRLKEIIDPSTSLQSSY